ncbi:TetR/AcrR family transcriptional regulator C-terminal domain-containing protein [Streptomyces sp. R-07]|uniref:TetR/AcrR family transcriptional regulator C-terminal domain-containing protein n=1 Tax=Streptomyces sp. R-07 TaxID=3404052 RepID=UPI003CF6C618
MSCAVVPGGGDQHATDGRWRVLRRSSVVWALAPGQWLPVATSSSTSSSSLARSGSRILEESHGRGDSHSSGEGEGEDEGAERDQMEAYFASLPPERFPHLVALAGTLMTGDADERFDFGLDVVVAGLAAHAGRD